MTSLAQFLLVVVITTLTILLAVVAVQVWQILSEVRQAIKKFNQILDNTYSVNQFFTDRVVSPTESRPEAAPEEIKHRFFHRSGLPLRAS